MLCFVGLWILVFLNNLLIIDGGFNLGIFLGSFYFALVSGTWLCLFRYKFAVDFILDLDSLIILGGQLCKVVLVELFLGSIDELALQAVKVDRVQFEAGRKQ